MMNNRKGDGRTMGLVRKAAIAVLALAWLGACADKPAPPPEKVDVAPQKVPTVAELLGGSIPRHQDYDDGFVYNRKDLRDPFMPFIKIETKKKTAEKPKVFIPKTPLQKFALEELRLVGIVWTEDERSKALIEDPKGKGYYVGAGTYVGDRGGKIIRIHPEKIVVEERIVDVLGEMNIKQFTLTLRKAEDEVNP